MTYSDTTLLIPTLNEEKNIPDLLLIVTKLYPEIKIAVVDDGSKDKTQDLVKTARHHNNNIFLLDRSSAPAKGITASILEGINSCVTPYFVVIDGDLQHPPEKIGELIAALRRGADVVIGVRADVASEWPIFRRLMSYGATMLGKLRLAFTGKMTTDPMSGFFGGNTTLFKEAYQTRKRCFVLSGYKVLFDFLKHFSKTTRLIEAPYVFGQRKQGTSKIGKKHILAYLKSVFS